MSPAARKKKYRYSAFPAKEPAGGYCTAQGSLREAGLEHCWEGICSCSFTEGHRVLRAQMPGCPRLSEKQEIY